MSTSNHTPIRHRDDDASIKNYLDSAASYCREQNTRLTANRRRVLEILLRERRPLSAYRILSRMSQTQGNVAPTSVYRALYFLLESQLIHRVNSNNSYLACHHLFDQSRHILVHCTTCDETTELFSDDLTAAVSQLARKHNFTLSDSTLELNALCSACSDIAGQDHDRNPNI